MASVSKGDMQRTRKNLQLLSAQDKGSVPHQVTPAGLKPLDTARLGGPWVRFKRALVGFFRNTRARQGRQMLAGGGVAPDSVNRHYGDEVMRVAANQRLQDREVYLPPPGKDGVQVTTPDEQLALIRNAEEVRNRVKSMNLDAISRVLNEREPDAVMPKILADAGLMVPSFWRESLPEQTVVFIEGAVKSLAGAGDDFCKTLLSRFDVEQLCAQAVAVLGARLSAANDEALRAACVGAEFSAALRSEGLLDQDTELRDLPYHTAQQLRTRLYEAALQQARPGSKLLTREQLQAVCRNAAQAATLHRAIIDKATLIAGADGEITAALQRAGVALKNRWQDSLSATNVDSINATLSALAHQESVGSRLLTQAALERLCVDAVMFWQRARQIRGRLTA